MASKDLKINIITDASGLATLSKGVSEISKGFETAATSASTLSKRLADAKNLVESFANKSARAYTNLTNKVDLYNDRITAGGRTGAAAWGNAQASTAKYNTEVQKAIELQRTLQNAIHLSVSTTSTNRGYTQNASGTVSSNRAAVAEAKEAQLLNQALAQENALRERLAISGKLYLDRINSVEVAKAAQQSRLLNESLAREAAIRERTTLAARAYLARVAEVNTIVAQTRTRNEQVASSYQDIINRLTMTARAYEATRLATQGFSQAQIQNIQRLQASSNALQDHERHTRNLFLRVGEAIGAYRIWNTLLNGIFNAPVAVTKVGIELEATQSILQSTMGSAAGAAGAMKFLDQEAARTGITISTLRTSWRDFSASTTLAGMSLKNTSEMFGNLDTVITALHLSTDRAQGVFNAMAQIFNKGKVQSEELVKQLGNLLPGAFASFAASIKNADGTIGIATQELSKRMKEGLVYAKDTMLDFTIFMRDKFAASFALASQGMNSNIGRMQTSFTHLGEAFYGLSSGPILDIIKKITSLTDTMTLAVKGTETYNDSIIALKSVVEAVFIVSIGTAIANVGRLKAALALLTIPNALLAGIAAIVAGVAYAYNKIESVEDRYRAAQKVIDDANSKKIFEDKNIDIKIRVAEAEPIKIAKAQIETLRKDLAAFEEEQANASAFNGTPKLSTKKFNTIRANRLKQIEELTRIEKEAEEAETMRMKAFDAENIRREQSLVSPESGTNLKAIRQRIRDTKLLLNDKLAIIDSASKDEQLHLQSSLSKIQNLYEQHSLTEMEYLQASDTAHKVSTDTQRALLQEKIAFLENSKKALGLDEGFKHGLLTSDEVTILESYNKALADNTTEIQGNKIAFDLDAQGFTGRYKASKLDLEQMQERAMSYEKLDDYQRRGIAVDKQVLGIKDELKALEVAETLRREKLGTTIINLNTLQLNALEEEKIKYLELIGALEEARIAKEKLAITKITQSDAPKSVQDQQITNVQLESANSAIDIAARQRDALLEIRDAYKDIGNTATTALATQLGGIQPVLAALDEMVKGAKAVQKERNEIADATEKANKIANPAAKEKALHIEQLKTIALDKAELATNLSSMSLMAGAASKMFAEKSSAAKAFHTIEIGLAAASMAMKLQEMALSMKEAAVNVMVGASKMFSQSGWFAFAGIAGMIAVMASLGYSGAMTGGSNSKNAIPTSSDTGSVLGDPTASSESVNNTYQLLKDIHADEYAELRGINKGIAGLSTGITDVVTRLFQAGGLSTVTPTQTNKIGGVLGMLNSIDPGHVLRDFDPIGSKIMSFLFGGKQTSTVTAQGIATNPTAISDVMAGNNLSAQQFANIETKTSGGFFGKDKISTSTQYAALDASTQKALNGVFKSMGTTMLSLADTLGTNLADRVNNYIIPAINVDLKGLDGEAAAKKLNGVISTALDSMATTVFGDIIGQYQQLGEGMLETAVRIVSEVAVVKDSLDKVGLILKDNAIAVSDAIVQAAGGLKEFQSLVEGYFSNFYSDAERNVFVQKQLNSQLIELNLLLPVTREGYRALISALDINNAADQQRYSLLLKLSGAADEYYTTLESASKDAQALLNQQRALDIQIMELSGNAIGALTEKRKDELAAMDASLRYSQQVVWAMQSANAAVDKAISEVNKAISNTVTMVGKAVSVLTALVSKLRAALASTAVSSDTLLAQERASARNVLNAALTTIQSGGSIEKFAGLDQALTTIAKPSQQLYSSFEEYATDQAYTGNVIAQIANSAEAQITEAQRQLDAINGTTSAVMILKDALEELSLAQLAQAQVNAVTGTTNAVLSLKDSIASLAQALDIKAALFKAIEIANTAVRTEATAKSNMEAAAAQAAQSQQNVANAIAAANTAAQAASSAQATANAPTVPAPTTYVNGQSGNAIWEQILSSFNAAHQARFGKPMNRAWSSDSDAQRQYQLLVAQYNVNSAAASAAAQASAAGLLEVANAAAALIPGYQATAQVDQAAASNAAAAYATASAYANAAKAAVPGINSFAIGTNFIESDRWAQVHRGERILPAADNRQLMQRLSTDKDDTVSQELISELKELRKTVAEQQNTLNEIAKSSKETAAILDTNSAGGGPMLVQVV